MILCQYLSNKKPLSILISLGDGVKIVTLLVAVTEHYVQYLSR